MARIRTIKPEFWSHPIIAKLDDATKLLAISLLNFADDEGYFLAEPNLVRGFCRPFDEDSKITRRSLDELSRIEFISICENENYGLIGRVEKFLKHQRIDRPNASKLKEYYSEINRRLIVDHSSEEKEKEKERKGKDFIDEIVDCFTKSYFDNFKIEYQITNKGKERGCAGKILKLYKQKYPESTSDDTLKGLKVYFDSCCQIGDTWLSNNMSLPIIIDKFNQINNILKNGNKQRKTGSGATDEQLANVIAKHFASDRPE